MNPHCTTLLHAGAGRLHERHRPSLAQNIPGAEAPLPQPFDIWRRAHRVGHGRLLLVGILSGRLVQRRRLRVLFLLRIGIAGFVVA